MEISRRDFVFVTRAGDERPGGFAPAPRRLPPTEEAYVTWVKRFVRFNRMRHPTTLGEKDLSRFLTRLADVDHVSPSTQNQALSAILFLYRHVLGRPLGWIENVTRAKMPRRVPVVLTPHEVSAVLAQLDGTSRVTPLSESALPLLEKHLRLVRRLHKRDLASGGAAAPLPHNFAARSPGAPFEWSWQFVFPASRRYVDEATGRPTPSPARDPDPARLQGGGAACQDHEACDVSHPAPFVCDASVGGWVRCADAAGVVGAQGPGGDDDLSARGGSGGVWGSESGGSALRIGVGCG